MLHSDSFISLLDIIRQSSGLFPRSYIKTLDIAQIDKDNFYIDIPSDWLHLVFHRLVNLKSLRASKTLFVDSQAIGLCRPPSHQNLHFLDISNCPNATADRIVNLLGLLPNLQYLDLSNLSGLAKEFVAKAIKGLRKLQVLRLRCCALEDAFIEEMFQTCLRDNVHRSHSFSSIRSIDLRHNRLSDSSMVRLADFHKSENLVDDYGIPSYNEALMLAGMPFNNEEATSWLKHAIRELNLVKDKHSNKYRPCDDPKQFMANLENPLHVKSKLFQAVPTIGLTSLYIDNKNVTLDGLLCILQLRTLEALDCGSVRIGKDELSGYPDLDTIKNSHRILQKLGNCKKLRYLRISHRLLGDHVLRRSLLEYDVSTKTFIDLIISN